MDKIGADFDRSVEMVKERLGAKPLVLQIPIGSESSLKGVVDLIEMRAIIWEDESLGAKFNYEDIPSDLQDKASKYREEMIETVVELDESAMEKYLEGEELDISTIKSLIRKGTCANEFYPVFCGSAFKNKGVQPLLDGVLDYLPSPMDVERIKGIDLKTEEIMVQSSDSEKVSLLAFKVMNDPFVGSLTFCRVYSGKVESGMQLLNSVKDKKERVGRMLLMHSNSRKISKRHMLGI